MAKPEDFKFKGSIEADMGLGFNGVELTCIVCQPGAAVISEANLVVEDGGLEAVMEAIADHVHIGERSYNGELKIKVRPGTAVRVKPFDYGPRARPRFGCRR